MNMRRVLIVLILLSLSSTVNAEAILDLKSYHGKVVLVDFWASWCVPCRRSFPWMNEMQQKYADDGLVIIGINLDQEIDDAKAFLAAYPAHFTVSYDPAGEIAQEYGVEVMPSSLLIGRNGNILNRHSGFKVKKQDEYETEIRSALGLEN